MAMTLTGGNIAAWFVERVSHFCKVYEPEMIDGSKFRVIFPGTLGYVNVGKRTGATIDGHLAG